MLPRIRRFLSFFVFCESFCANRAVLCYSVIPVFRYPFRLTAGTGVWCNPESPCLLWHLVTSPRLIRLKSLILRGLLPLSDLLFQYFRIRRMMISAPPCLTLVTAEVFLCSRFFDSFLRSSLSLFQALDSLFGRPCSRILRHFKFLNS